MPRKQPSEDIIQQVIIDYNSGMKCTDIAKKYHIDFTRLKKKLIAEKRILPRKKGLTLQQLEEITDRYKNGEFLNKLADEYGIGIAKLMSDLKKNNLYFKKYEFISDSEAAIYIEEYKNGMTPKDISIKYGRGDTSIIDTLQKAGIYKQTRKQWTDEEIDILKQYYPVEPVDDVIKRLPRPRTRQNVYSKASTLNIKGYSPNEWSDEELTILKEKYGKVSSEELYLEFNKRHSKLAIRTKAQRLGYQTDPFWTEQEENTLINNYSSQPFEVLQSLFPNKTEWSIRHHARKLGLKSKQYLDEKYSEEQINYIKNNWLILTDEQMADELNKSPAGIMAQRNKMGLYKIKKDYSKYVSLDKFFRGHIQQWKTDSMDSCNHQCIFTGSKDFAIHHIYGFNNILKEVYEILDNQNLLKSTRIEDYSKSELDCMLKIFNEIHNKYPLGVCLRKDIHNLFHKIYGSGGNTIEQWNKFYEDFKNNLYEKEIA